MPLIKWEPFEEMEKIFEETFPPLRKGFVPPIDVYRKDNYIIAETPIVGVKPQDVNVRVKDDVLTIEGKSEQKEEVKEEDYYRKEVRYGSFHRSISLPVGVIEDQAKASYEDGMLKVIIPVEKTAEEKAVKVQVKALKKPAKKAKKKR